MPQIDQVVERIRLLQALLPTESQIEAIRRAQPKREQIEEMLRQNVFPKEVKEVLKRLLKSEAFSRPPFDSSTLRKPFPNAQDSAALAELARVAPKAAQIEKMRKSAPSPNELEVLKEAIKSGVDAQTAVRLQEMFMTPAILSQLERMCPTEEQVKQLRARMLTAAQRERLKAAGAAPELIARIEKSKPSAAEVEDLEKGVLTRKQIERLRKAMLSERERSKLLGLFPREKVTELLGLIPNLQQLEAIIGSIPAPADFSSEPESPNGGPVPLVTGKRRSRKGR